MGFGSKLLNNTEQLMKDKNVDIILLSVLEDSNGSLSHFYFKNSYQLNKINNKSIDNGDTLKDNLILCKYL